MVWVCRGGPQCDELTAVYRRAAAVAALPQGLFDYHDSVGGEWLVSIGVRRQGDQLVSMPQGLSMDAELWEACTDPGLLVPVLLEQPSIRKLRLLACAIVRAAPYDRNRRNIWDLLPTFGWSRWFTCEGKPVDCRDVVRIAERSADGRVSDAEWQEAREHAGYACWSAVVDTYGLDENTFAGSNFRYAPAIAVRQTVEEQPERLAKFLFHYLSYMAIPFDPVSPGLLHPENQRWACMLTRDVFGNPFRPVIFNGRWESGEVLTVASKIDKEQCYDLMPALGAALKRAGCGDDEILRHCSQGPHVKGCWVVDQILGRA